MADVTPERFWRLVPDRPSDGCWPWNGRTDRYGYGRYTYGPRPNRKDSGAHRVAFELVIGRIPDGLVIDHLCRNRRCVNPAHLEPVTNAENLRRGALGRNPTPSLAFEYAAGASLDSLAEKYGMHRQSIAYRLLNQGVQLRPRGRPRKTT